MSGQLFQVLPEQGFSPGPPGADGKGRPRRKFLLQSTRTVRDEEIVQASSRGSDGGFGAKKESQKL
ncbi:MAG: hypothetical protein EBS53_12305 [Bacteroidetes bacterium]|nr:hypothetical protein [Bacteroidota bacterium]